MKTKITFVLFVLSVLSASALNWTNYPFATVPDTNDTFMIGTTTTNKQVRAGSLLGWTETNAVRRIASSNYVTQTLLISTSNGLVSVITSSTNGLASTNYANSIVASTSNALLAVNAVMSNYFVGQLATKASITDLNSASNALLTAAYAADTTSSNAARSYAESVVAGYSNIVTALLGAKAPTNNAILIGATNYGLTVYSNSASGGTAINITGSLNATGAVTIITGSGSAGAKITTSTSGQFGGGNNGSIIFARSDNSYRFAFDFATPTFAPMDDNVYNFGNSTKRMASMFTMAETIYNTLAVSNGISATNYISTSWLNASSGITNAGNLMTTP